MMMMPKLYDVTAFSDDVEQKVLAVCSGVDKIMTAVIEAEYARNFPSAKIKITSSEGAQPVEQKPLKIYSLLMAWSMSDLAIQGTYSIVLWARDTGHAIDQARWAMLYENRGADFDENEFDEHDDDKPEEYMNLDIVEGANIWAAPQMLDALKMAKNAMWSNSNHNISVANDAIDAAIDAATPDKD